MNITDLSATLGDSYAVTTTERGWVEVRVNPATALRDKLDFIRIVNDDGTLRVIHLTHNEVLRGEATFNNSLTGFMPTFVREMCESIF